MHHPDARGGRPSPDMASINEAYRVLSDPGRRLDYDRTLRAQPGPARPSVPSSPSPRPSSGHTSATAAFMEPPRFPWRFALAVFVVGTVGILVVGALTQPGEPAPVDNVLRAGDCVVIEPATAVVSEVRCDDIHDAVVERLIPFDTRCPTDLEAFRDRQGMGVACVRRL